MMLVSIGIYCNAQSYTEVVYLKNGSVIKGTIIEQVPNVSLKIKTNDGSLIICKMDDVEKITKEEKYSNSYRNNTNNRKLARQTLRGYKGFVDMGYVVDLSDNNANKLEISTSHGYQFNNYFYVGGGVAVDYYTDADLISAPIFADFRANFINKKVTPFADIKTGYSFGDVEGVYVTTGVGVRFSLRGKKAINLKLEYNYQQYDYNDSYYSYSYGGYRYYDDTLSLEGLGFKVGFEF